MWRELDKPYVRRRANPDKRRSRKYVPTIRLTFCQSIPSGGGRHTSYSDVMSSYCQNQLKFQNFFGDPHAPGARLRGGRVAPSTIETPTIRITCASSPSSRVPDGPPCASSRPRGNSWAWTSRIAHSVKTGHNHSPPEHVGADNGPVFRSISRHGQVQATRLSGIDVARVVKKLAQTGRTGHYGVCRPLAPGWTRHQRCDRGRIRAVDHEPDGTSEHADGSALHPGWQLVSREQRREAWAVACSSTCPPLCLLTEPGCSLGTLNVATTRVESLSRWCPRRRANACEAFQKFSGGSKDILGVPLLKGIDGRTDGGGGNQQCSGRRWRRGG
jgi:hypothetical protein